MTVATSSLSLRDQWIIGGQFVLDLRLAALLDMQHLVHLVPHRFVILEVEGRKGADLDAPAALDLSDPFALLAAHRGVFGRRHNVPAGQLALVAGQCVHSHILASASDHAPGMP